MRGLLIATLLWTANGCGRIAFDFVSASTPEPEDAASLETGVDGGMEDASAGDAAAVVGQTFCEQNFPTWSSTGPSDPSILVDSGSITTSADNEVIENIVLRAGSGIDIRHTNIVLRNFRIESDNSGPFSIVRVAPEAGEVLIERGEILYVGPDQSDRTAISLENNPGTSTVRHVRMRGMGRGLHLSFGVTAEGNYLEDGGSCFICGLAPCEDIQIRNNSCIGGRGYGVFMDGNMNIEVVGNLFERATDEPFFTLQLSDGSGVVSDNIFVPPSAGEDLATGSGIVTSNNRRSDTCQPTP